MNSWGEEYLRDARLPDIDDPAYWEFWKKESRRINAMVYGLEGHCWRCGVPLDDHIENVCPAVRSVME